MVDEAVLRRVVLRFERTEQGLLRTEDLHGARGVLREVEQAARVTDEPRADELADERGQVRRDRVHAVAQVLRELRAVRGDRDDLVAERVYVHDVGVGDFGAHGDLGCGLQGRLEVFGEDSGEVGCGSVCPESCGDRL